VLAACLFTDRNFTPKRVSRDPGVGIEYSLFNHTLIYPGEEVKERGDQLLHKQSAGIQALIVQQPGNLILPVNLLTQDDLRRIAFRVGGPITQ
jgi:hypothetical protein